MHKLFLGLIITVTSSFGAAYSLYTNDYLGKFVIECGDTLIVHPNHSILNTPLPKCISVIICPTTHCRDNEIKRLKNLYRTNGIYVGIIK